MRARFVLLLTGVAAMSANVYAVSFSKDIDVNVINTPDVTVTNPQTSVTVDNQTTSPIPVTVQAGAPIQPAQHYQTIQFPEGATVYRESVWTVPSDKRLVLQHVSVQYSTTSSTVETRAVVEISDIPGACPQDPKMRLVLPVPVMTATSPSRYNTIVSQPITLYADPDDHICVHLDRNSDEVNRDVGVHMVGYYVDVP